MDRLKTCAEKVKKEANELRIRLKAVEAEVVGLRKEFSGKDEAFQLSKDRVNALEAECKQKDDLIVEASSRATEAEICGQHCHEEVAVVWLKFGPSSWLKL